MKPLFGRNKLQNIKIFRGSKAGILSKSTPSTGIPSLLGLLPLKSTAPVSLCYIVHGLFLSLNPLCKY